MSAHIHVQVYLGAPTAPMCILLVPQWTLTELLTKEKNTPVQSALISQQTLSLI